MGNSMRLLRYIFAVAVFIVGWQVSFAGWLHASGEHGAPHLALGVALSFAGLEITMLSYVVVRTLPWEVVFRVVVYLYLFMRMLLSVFTGLGAKWPVIGVGIPLQLAGAGEESFEVTIFSLVFAALCLANLVFLYKWAGLNWRVKGAS